MKIPRGTSTGDFFVHTNFYVGSDAVLALVTEKQKNAADQATEQQNQYANSRRGLLRLHLVKRNKTDDRSDDRNKSHNNTDNDKNLCRCFHNFFLQNNS